MINSQISGQFRGEVFASPFLYLIILSFCSICFSQLGSERWLHPVQYQNSHFSDSTSHIKFWNNSHIGVWDFEDSLKLFHIENGVQFKKRLSKSAISIDYLNTNNFIELIDTTSHHQYKQKYQSISFGYRKHFDKFAITTVLNFNEKSPFSFKSNFNYHVNNQILFGIEYSQINTPLSLFLSFNDFLYNPQNIVTKSNRNKFSIHYDKKWILTKASCWYNYSDISSDLDYFKSTENNEVGFSTSGLLKTFQTQKIEWFYDFIKKNTGFEFFQNDIRFLKINCFDVNIHRFGLRNSWFFSNSQISLGLTRQQLEFAASTRLRTSVVSDDLSTLFGAPIVNGKDDGSLTQSNVYIQYVISGFKSTFSINASINKEAYDLNFITTPIGFLGLPASPPQTQKTNIIGKDAVNFGVKYDIQFKSTLLHFSFDQQIPVNIKYIEALEEDVIERKIYGGGLFQVSIIKLF